MTGNYLLTETTGAHRPAIMDIMTTDFPAYFEQAFPDVFFARFREIADGYPHITVLGEPGNVAGFGFLHPFRADFPAGR